MSFGCFLLGLHCDLEIVRHSKQVFRNNMLLNPLLLLSYSLAVGSIPLMLRHSVIFRPTNLKLVCECSKNS